MSWAADLVARLREAALEPAPKRKLGRPKGLPQTAEARARRGEAAKRAWADPEVRARRSEAAKRAWADPEVRARMSEASKRALADPEVRARMSEARKRAWADPEVRARMIEASKRALAGAPKEIECPKWVPRDLVGEFFEVAATFGEAAAAGHIRRLKREMAA